MSHTPFLPPFDGADTQTDLGAALPPMKLLTSHEATHDRGVYPEYPPFTAEDMRQLEKAFYPTAQGLTVILATMATRFVVMRSDHEDPAVLTYLEAQGIIEPIADKYAIVHHTGTRYTLTQDAKNRARLMLASASRINEERAS